MKRNILIFLILLVFTGTFFTQSCKEESTPFETHGAFTIPALVAPVNGSFLALTGNTVELKWSSTDADGDPNKWDIYFGPSEDPAKVKSAHTSQSYTVSVNPGTKYYWRVVGYDANGIITRSDVWSFEVVDSNAPLKVKMDWSTDVLDKIGLDVDPVDAVDLRLKILKEDNSELIIVDTGGFEEYSFNSSLPDGKYFIVTDLSSTINAGDFNSSLDIDVNLSFNQKGILSSKLQYPSAMTNDFTCDSYYTILAEVTKVGSTYTIKNIGKAEWAADLPSLAGTWTGIDNWDYNNEVVVSLKDNKLYVYGLGFAWMGDYWGETIVKGNPVPLVFDWTTLGGVEIENQYYITTVYKGVEYPYQIVGTGKLVLCGENPVLSIEYDLIQDGFSIGDYYKELFKVDLTLAPAAAGFKGISIKTESSKLRSMTKPVR